MRRLREAALLGLIAGEVASGAAAPRLSGAWALELQRDANVTYVADCVWDHDGDGLSGGCTSGFSPVGIVRGRVHATDVSFTMTVDDRAGLTVECVGGVNDGGSLVAGEWRLVDGDGRRESGRFTATRRPAGADSSGSLQ